MPHVRFDAALEADSPAPAEVVIRSGKLFGLGSYPDKAFSLTAAEADAAVAAFRPVPADYEHTPGPLDGQLGDLTRVWRDGDSLYGEATVPAWLDPLLAESGRKLSLAWDRAAKTIVGWGWVRTPRVSDAALMSAYAAFAGARHNGSDQRALNSAHDAIVAAGADNCTGLTQEAHMSKPTLLERLRALLDETPAADFSEDDPRTPLTPPAPVVVGIPPAPAPLPTAEFAAMQSRLAQLEAERRAEQALTFADSQVQAGHILPAARPFVLAAFTQALADDATAPTVVTFADATGVAQTGGRADVLRAVFATLGAHTLTTERVPAGTVLLAATAHTGPSDDEKRARLDYLKQLALSAGDAAKEG